MNETPEYYNARAILAAGVRHLYKYECRYCGTLHNDDAECPECNVMNHSNDDYE